MLADPVLVTGGCGFVGSPVCARLVADGREVVILDNLTLGTPANLPTGVGHVQLIEADIRDADAVRRCLTTYRPRTVIHLAAIHFIPACNADPRRAIDVNVTGTQALLDGCAASGTVASIVLASSAAVYAPSEAPLHEEHALGPVDIYGHTKLWNEQQAALFHRRTGIAVGIARLFNQFGPGETNAHLIPSIIEQARAGGPLRLGNLASRRDYLSTDDAARGLIALAAACRERGNLTCNFGSERAVDGWDLVRLIERLHGGPLVVEQDPAKLRPADNPVILSDCTRAHELLGWRAETTLEEGLAAALRQPRAVGFTPGISTRTP
ncbi:MAG: GDP-mannose 4,6-dehydratase [Thermomicrobia bacterium]|nr:GDP-mannose 4,6-dehydratase [Thermomicrobia bacterium]MCA1723476.1 GDP-mannose 4,6-dehydratase [Thermomicrobia bacterium]